jgi:hypothetical protein
VRRAAIAPRGDRRRIKLAKRRMGTLILRRQLHELLGTWRHRPPYRSLPQEATR